MKKNILIVLGVSLKEGERYKLNYNDSYGSILVERTIVQTSATTFAGLKEFISIDIKLLNDLVGTDLVPKRTVEVLKYIAEKSFSTVPDKRLKEIENFYGFVAGENEFLIER